MIQIKLYGDLRKRAGKQTIEIEYREQKLIEIIENICEIYGLKQLIFRNNKVRGELLILVNGADWNSLGYLDRKVEDNSLIKLVPVWHGG